MDKLEIINRISICRNNANLSARALSQRIELNDGYINRLESKKDFLPSLDVLLKIIEECGITAEHFFYENLQDYEKDKKLLNLFNNLTPEKKDLLIQFLSIK